MKLMLKRFGRATRRAALSLFVLSTALLATGFAKSTASRAFEDPGYDANGNAPPFHTLCPTSFPAPGWPYVASMTFYLPKFGLPAGDEVPFRIVPTSLNPNIQPVTVGFGWYIPSPTSVHYDNMDWDWQGDSPSQGPGVLLECFRTNYLWGAFWFNSAFYTGQKWGHAFPVIGSGTSGTDNRPTGGDNGGENGGGENCYEAYNWWYDVTGYHELFAGKWCEHIYAT